MIRQCFAVEHLLNLMKTLDYARVMVKAARLYYDDGLTQAEIAERLRLSRQRVQRLLHQAHADGIVQISVNPLVGVFSDLERALEAEFGLAEAIVVETTASAASDGQVTAAREVGAGAAEYLLRVVRPKDRILISWGNSVLGMVNVLSRPRHIEVDELTVIQGLGGLGDPNDSMHATQLVKRAAYALSAQAVLLPAPAVAGTLEARDALCRDPYVARTLEMARAADLAFIGIGSLRSESILLPEFWKIMTPSILSELKKGGAVGSTNLRYFDERGRRVRSRFDDCVIGLTLDEIRKIPRVVGLAGGSTKLPAIRAALEGELLDVLVTDHLTAQQLLKERKVARSER